MDPTDTADASAASISTAVAAAIAAFNALPVSEQAAIKKSRLAMAGMTDAEAELAAEKSKAAMVMAARQRLRDDDADNG